LVKWEEKNRLGTIERHSNVLVWYALPEFGILFVKEDVFRTLGRNIEVWSIDSEALKEWRSNEVRGVRLYRGERTKFKFSLRREAEEVFR